jgi:hypothetical protein
LEALLNLEHRDRRQWVREVARLLPGREPR